MNLRKFTNKRGVFKLTGAPGEYILLAQPVLENKLTIFDYVRARAPTGTRVTLKPGDSSDVEIVAPPTR